MIKFLTSILYSFIEDNIENLTWQDVINKYDDERLMKKFEFSHLDRNIQRIRRDLQIKSSGTAFEIIKQNMTKIENYYKNHSVFKVSINYGNHMDVADNIWRTIHNPITIEMITTGQNIPNISQEEEKYYKNCFTLFKGCKFKTKSKISYIFGK